MTNDQNIVRGRHLDSLAADAKRFTLEQNLALNQAIQAELAELDTGTSYDVFTGATSSTGGLSGLVPAPQAGDESKFLRGDGTWSGELILPTVSNSVNGGFWLDVSGTPPAPKFYYGGKTYTFVAELPSNPYFLTGRIAKLYKDAQGIFHGDEMLEFDIGEQAKTFDVPASALQWNQAKYPYSDGCYQDVRIIIGRTDESIPFPTTTQVTLSGYVPQGKNQPFYNTNNVVGSVNFHLRNTYTESASIGGTLTVTFNTEYEQVPLTVNWYVPQSELIAIT